tara:strand:+ start:14059 stop:14397 length:339 start_codon:yes stop_codon:yes gene_type:complete
MSKSALFKNKIDISGNLDISGDLTLSGTLELDASATINIHGLDIPSLPTDLCGQVLAVNSSGDSLEWIKSDAVGGTTSDSNFYENATTDATTSGGSGTTEFYSSLLSTLSSS